MKKIIRIAAIIVVLLVAALMATPFLLKDKLKVLVKEEANNMLNAEFYFGGVSLSFFRDFPNATVSIEDYGIVGQDLFEGDTLIAGKRFDLEVNPFKVIFSDAIPLKAISLESPKLQLITLKDGTVNYDIVKADTTATESIGSSSSSGFQIEIENYNVSNATFIYDDATLPMRMEMYALNHSGSGNVTTTNYILSTQSTTPNLKVVYDGISYLNKAVVDAQMDMHIEMEPNIKVTFLDNTATLNALPIGLDGFIALVGEDIEMDINFDSKSATFQSLLSMVPGMYTADFQDIETDGTLAFNGYAKGTYNETQMPAFGLDLTAADAWFKYPDLPTKVSGINVDMHIANPDGDLEKTKVDIRSFHADFGNNPIDAKAVIEGIERMKLDGYLKASLNLAELTSMIPVEGTTLKGLFNIDASAKGIYDEAKGIFPKVDASMNMTDGYTKNEDYSVELSDMGFTGRLVNTDGSMKNTSLDVSNFHFELDGELIKGNAHIHDFDDPNYRIQASGKLDLEKLMQLYPIEGMDVKGTLIVDDFSTQGKMSDVEAEKYTQLPTSGKVRVENLYYSDVAYPQAVTVEQASARFTPDRMEISQASGKLGSSDYRVNGYFSNYLAFAMMDDQPLQGEMSLRSQRMNLNEWMVEAEETSGETTESTSEAPAEELSIIPVPANVEVSFDAEIEELIYDNLNLKEMKGMLIVADQEVNMQNLGFNMLGATVQMNGAYNTRNERKPGYEFFMDIKNLKVQDAWASFNTVQAFAPVSEHVQGLFNTTFGIKGSLKPNMMPYLEDITSLGIFEVLQGGLNNIPVLNKISDATKLKDLAPVQLKDLAAKFEIEDGALKINPFTVNHKDMKMKISGRQYVTGKMDYEVDMDVPSGSVGQAVGSALADLSGGAVQTGDRFQFTFKLGGTFKAPTISGLGSSAKTQIQAQASDAIKDKIKDESGIEVPDIPLDSTSIKKVKDSIKQQVKDSIETVLDETKEQVKDSLKNKTDEIKDSLEKRVEEELGKEVKSQLDSLKKVIGFPKLGKKKKKNN